MFVKPIPQIFQAIKEHCLLEKSAINRELEKDCSTGFVLMSKQMEIQTPLAFYDKDTVGKLIPQVNNWKSRIQLSLVQMYVGWNPLEW